MTLTEHLKQAESGQRVDEVLLTLIAAACVAYCCKPLLETDAMKSLFGGIGMMFQGIGSMFHRKEKKDDDKDDKKRDRDRDNDRDDRRDNKRDKRNDRDDDDKDDKKSDKKNKKNSTTSKPDKKEASAMLANLHALAQQSIDREKDENLKKTLQGQLDVARACSVDANGEPLDYEKYQERVKEVTGMDAAEWAKQAGVKELSKEDFEKVQEGLKKELDKMSPEDRAKVAEDEHEKAQRASKDIMKKKADLEKAQKELDDLKKKAGVADADKKKDLAKQIEEKSDEVKQAADALGTGVLGKQAVEDINKEADAAKEDAEKKEDAQDDKKEDKKDDKEPTKEHEDKKDEKKEDAQDDKKEDKKDDKDDKAEEPEKTYELTHDGKPDKLIRRPKKRGEGSTWCWASDRDTTVAPDQAREMLKKAGIKESMSLSEWLSEWL